MVKLCGQLFVTIVIDANVNSILLMIGKVLRSAITPETDRITAAFDRCFSDVFDVSFLLKERMLTFGRHQDKKSVPAKIPDVGFSDLLSSPTGILRIAAVVFLHQLSVDRLPFLARRDSPADIEPVATADQSGREVVNKVVSISC